MEADTPPRLVVLLAEDDPDDLFLMRRAFRQAHLDCEIHVGTNGEDVIAYVSGEGPFSNRTLYPFPDVILLDLHMPRASGFEVLEHLHHLRLPEPPRVVLVSSTCSPRELERAFALGVHSHAPKSGSYQAIVDALKQLQSTRS